MSKATTDQIKDVLEAMRAGKTSGKVIRFNVKNRALEVVPERETDPDDVLRIRPEDAQVFLREII